ncbi:DUF4465 domain-containing protein [Bacteroides sp. 224]|uniref:DUF4465 domain-containing protein n=1 Tax=Bacteroides sp. 224 TaxID=2302936 RepID=UPI001EF32B26|nr:DUF4465 domain-containing protein [Bacteroides sp. 224]
MKKLPLWMMLIAALVFTGCSSDDDNGNNENNGNNGNNKDKEEYIISFNNLLSEKETSFLGKNGVEEGMYLKEDFQDTQSYIRFNHYYSEYGFGGGFTYTNTTNKTTPGYLNLSAITGTGKYEDTYLTIKTDNFTKARLTILNPAKYALKEMWITNSTYAYLAMKDGNDGYLNNTKFGVDGKEDTFLLTIKAYSDADSSIGHKEFYLADFRNGKSAIVNDWVRLDLSDLANTNYLEFELTSTDNNEYGMKTPAYFCIDGITIIEK